MIVYYTLIVMIIILGTATKRGSGKAWIIPVSVLMILVYALRYRVGADFGGFYRTFHNVGIETWAQVRSRYSEFLFCAVQYVLYYVLNGNWIMYCVVLGIIAYVPVLVTIDRESKYPIYSTLLFIFTMSYFAEFNGVRQGLAVAVVFYGYYAYFRKERYIPFAISMAIAYGFHSTVLLIIPFLLLSKLPLKSITIKITVVALLLSFVFLWSLWSRVIQLFGLLGQDKLANDYAQIVDANGSSALRMIVYLVPSVLAMCFYKRLNAHYEDVDSEIILCLFAGIFMLFSTKYWIFARVALYFNMFSIILIPKFEVLFAANSRKLARCLIGGLYFAYMIVMLLHGDGSCYPYQFIFGQV